MLFFIFLLLLLAFAGGFACGWKARKKFPVWPR